MRCPTAAALAVAALLAAPEHASAKGFAAASVCGADGCRAVARAAARTGFEDVTSAERPARAAPFLTIHLRARVSNGRVAEVYALDCLPDAGVMRGNGEREWTRSGPALDRALHRAARRLRRHPAAELGSVDDAPPPARVVEVFAPAREDRSAPAAPVAAALIAAAAALATLRRRRRKQRPAAPPSRRR